MISTTSGRLDTEELDKNAKPPETPCPPVDTHTHTYTQAYIEKVQVSGGQSVQKSEQKKKNQIIHLVAHMQQDFCPSIVIEFFPPL